MVLYHFYDLYLLDRNIVVCSKQGRCNLVVPKTGSFSISRTKTVILGTKFPELIKSTHWSQNQSV